MNTKEAEARTAIQAGYDAEDAAMARKDLNGTLAYHAADYVAIGRTGKTHGLKEERQSFQDAFAFPSKSARFTSQILELILQNKSGTQATVTVKRASSSVITDPETGRSGTLATEAVARHFWVKEAAGWRIKREKLLTMKASLDGKPLGRG